jgi:RNA polymerase sigma-70 factor (ECF subfamily)
MAADEAIAPDEPPASDDPDWDRIERAIRSLPERQREVMTLRIDGQLTFSQIAQVVGVSVSTAASRYRYALAKLRASLAGAGSCVEGRR